MYYFLFFFVHTWTKNASRVTFTPLSRRKLTCEMDSKPMMKERHHLTSQRQRFLEKKTNFPKRPSVRESRSRILSCIACLLNPCSGSLVCLWMLFFSFVTTYYYGTDSNVRHESRTNWTPSQRIPSQLRWMNEGLWMKNDCKPLFFSNFSPTPSLTRMATPLF